MQFARLDQLASSRAANSAALSQAHEPADSERPALAEWDQAGLWPALVGLSSAVTERRRHPEADAGHCSALITGCQKCSALSSGPSGSARMPPHRDSSTYRLGRLRQRGLWRTTSTKDRAGREANDLSFLPRTRPHARLLTGSRPAPASDLPPFLGSTYASRFHAPRLDSMGVCYALVVPRDVPS